jgi:stage II sporulation protein AA (anti-sigma F factor antagonist)
LKAEAFFKDGKLTLCLNGELDHHGAREIMQDIEERIDEYLPHDCVLDMSGISFMDSSGIAVILKTYRRMNELGGRAFIKGVPPQPMRVLDASGIERMIDIS